MELILIANKTIIVQTFLECLECSVQVFTTNYSSIFYKQ